MQCDRPDNLKAKKVNMFQHEISPLMKMMMLEMIEGQRLRERLVRRGSEVSQFISWCCSSHRNC